MQINSKKTVYYLSFIATIIFSFTPKIGIRVANEVFQTYYFGFPTQWLGYHEGGQFSFQVFNLLFNFFVFYFLFRIVMKILKSLKNR
ncbi:hypothetical protein A3863_07695 (plasmid) [Priestia endophytica]|nr:hypothetical protein A3863_07695 [Priestia endophytica]